MLGVRCRGMSGFDSNTDPEDLSKQHCGPKKLGSFCGN